MLSQQEEMQLRRLLRMFAGRKPVIGVAPPLETRAAGDGQIIAINQSYLAGGGGQINNAAFELPAICGTTDAYGNVTGLKRVALREDGAVVCLPLKVCCPSRWYCVDNEWLYGDVGACCPGSTPTANRFKATAYIKVEFRNKTGYADDDEFGLPDGIFLYSVDGLTWLGGGSGFQMSCTSFTGGLTVSCVSGTLTATWGVSGFSGGTPTTLPSCTLTGTAVSLGTFNVDLKECRQCDDVDAPTSTVEVWISSVLNGSGDAQTPLEVPAGYIPPYVFGDGPFYTEEQALECCESYVSCCPDDPLPFVIQCAFTSRTGFATNFPSVASFTRLASTGLLSNTWRWTPGNLPSCSTGAELSLICGGGGTWTLSSGATLIGPVPLPPASGSCRPFEQVFNVPSAAYGCGTMSYTATFTA